MLETVEKFEEDLTDAARIHGKLKVIIDVGESIEVPTRREKGVDSDPLMVSIRDQLEQSLSETQNDCRMYSAD